MFNKMILKCFWDTLSSYFGKLIYRWCRNEVGVGLQSQGGKGVKWYDVDPPGSLSFSMCASQEPNSKKEILPENIVHGLRDCPGFAQVAFDFVEFGTERLNRWWWWWWCRIEAYVFLNFTPWQKSDEIAKYLTTVFVLISFDTLMNLPFSKNHRWREWIGGTILKLLSLFRLQLIFLPCNCSSASLSGRWPRKVASLWNLRVPRWGRWMGRGQGKLRDGVREVAWKQGAGCWNVRCLLLSKLRWQKLWVQNVGNEWESLKSKFPLYIDFLFWCCTTPY